MTITQLEYIIAVDTFKSFAEAANRCFVTQPTLSMQVKKLEEELGTILFDRSRKPVLTTDIGKSIIEQARVTVQQARLIRELVESEREAVTGELRIGIIPTLSPYLLPLFILKFVQKYPEIKVSIEELTSERLIDKLYSDQLDVGILVTPLHKKGLIETALFYELFVVYMSSQHPLHDKGQIDFKDLNIDEMWLLAKGHCFRNQVVNLCGDHHQHQGHNLRFESGSLETLRRIVDQQYGFTLLPELATLDMDSEQYQHIKHFKNPQPVREVSLVRHQNYVKARLVKLLEEEILDNVPEILKNPNRGKLVEWTSV